MYTTQDGETKIRANFDVEQNTVWLSQAQMAELFMRDQSTISKHINNTYKDGELDKKSTMQKMHIANSDKPVEFFNLDVIISVGYRVKSLRGSQFRIWATKILHEYIKKGFAMNDELLKEAGGGNYFKELIQRIRDIRSSEKVFYRQILDIYATSIDYDPKAEVTKEFFKIVQNKMFYAVNKMTAPEIIVGRANAELPFMGLTAFRGNFPMKSEVNIAKNYLSEQEIKSLNRIVSMYLDYAEEMAEQEKAMTMQDWVKKLDKFLQFNNKEILLNAGSISREIADEHAFNEYDKYREKTHDELTQVERDFLQNIKETYKLLENKKK